MEKRCIYHSPKAEIICLGQSDVITTSIFEDKGDNDGEWTGFRSNRSQSIGFWN